MCRFFQIVHNGFISLYISQVNKENTVMLHWLFNLFNYNLNFDISTLAFVTVKIMNMTHWLKIESPVSYLGKHVLWRRKTSSNGYNVKIITTSDRYRCSLHEQMWVKDLLKIKGRPNYNEFYFFSCSSQVDWEAY